MPKCHLSAPASFPGTISLAPEDLQLGGEIARHAGPAGRFSAYLGLPGCQYGVEAGRHTIPIIVVPGHLVGQPRWENDHRAFIALENDLGLVIGSTSPGNDFGL